jgi:hypothetical protein
VLTHLLSAVVNALRLEVPMLIKLAINTLGGATPHRTMFGAPANVAVRLPVKDMVSARAIVAAPRHSTTEVSIVNAILFS